MKKKKLKLKELKVQSFLTDLKKEEKRTVMGGMTVGDICGSGAPVCGSDVPACNNTFPICTLFVPCFDVTRGCNITDEVECG